MGCRVGNATHMTDQLKTVAKAIAAACAGFVGALATASADGSVTGPEWGIIAATTIGAFAVTWAVPNSTLPIEDGL